MRYLLSFILSSLIILFINSCMPAGSGYQQSPNALGFLLPIIVIIGIVLFIVLKKKKSDDEAIPDFSSVADKDFTGFANKVVKLNFKGGLIGFLIDNPHKALQKRVMQENKNGWRVIQVIPDISGNLFVYLFRFILLIITLFLYTQANGYFIIFEQKFQETE